MHCAIATHPSLRLAELPLIHRPVTRSSARPPLDLQMHRDIASDPSLAVPEMEYAGTNVPRIFKHQLCSYVTLAFTYKCFFPSHIRLFKPRVPVSNRAQQRLANLRREGEDTSVSIAISSTCPTKTRDLWITDCATLGDVLRADSLPRRRNLGPRGWRRRIDESYRNGACRRLCIRRGGRQTDEAIDEGHSPVIEKAGRNPKLRVIFPDEHLVVQLVFVRNVSLA